MNILREETVFAVETNPRLTGNVKITIDEGGGIWLNSIDSNPTLSSIQFKRFKVDPRSTYGTDLRRLFEGTPGIEDSLYSKPLQSDGLYSSGPRGADEGLYPGFTLSYFAPIWCTSMENFPDTFVVFHVPHYAFNSQSLTKAEQRDLIFKNGRIVKSWDCQKGPLGDYLANHFSKCSSPSYQVDNFPPGYQIFGINHSTGSYSLAYTRGENLTDEQISRKYQDLGLVNPYLLNFEFLFSDPIQSSGPSSYYGVWVDKETIAGFHLDWEEHNKELTDIQISDWHFNDLDREKFQIESEDGIRVYIESFINNVPQVNYQPKEGLFYALTGKEKDLHIVKDIKTSYLPGQRYVASLNSKSLNLADYIGIDRDRTRHIQGFVLPNEGHDSIYITLDKWKNRTVLQSGDSLIFRCRLLDSDGHFEYRLIADSGGCCSPSRGCFYKGITLRIRTNVFDIQYGPQNSKIIHMKIPGIRNDFTEGDILKVSNDFFDGVNFPIEAIDYDFENSKTILTIVDRSGVTNGFGDSLNFFAFDYVSPSYQFDYFNFEGSPETVARSMAESINEFANRLFHATPYRNGIIVRSMYPGDLYRVIDVSYDLTKTDTPLQAMNFNGVPAQPHRVLAADGSILFERKRGSVSLIGSSGKGGRFAIGKGKESGLDGSEVITSRKGYSSLRSVPIGERNIRHSLYTDEPIWVNDEILGFKNVDRFSVLSIEDDKDEIRPTSTGTIGLNVRYNGSVSKYRTITIASI